MSGRAPFVKWAGGKRKLVPFIKAHLPLPAKRLVEPFAGGAAVSLALADRVESIWLNDVNVDLINIYESLRDDPEKYIEDARRLFSSNMNEPEAYYRQRQTFNETDCAYERAVIFLYLNRHGYNGLCRYNSSGQFNVPFGRYKHPYFPEQELSDAAAVLKKAAITTVDFERVLDECGAGDVVYCDPPYVPLTTTASFTDYAAGGFGRADQERLANAAERARRRGAVVAISNHDTEFTRRLYRDAECYYRSVRRTISCDGENRRAVREVLAVYLPPMFRSEAGRRRVR